MLLPKFPPVPGAATRVAALLILLISPGGVYAQFQVYQWANFEQGMPEGSVTFGKHATDRVQTVDLGSVPGMPPEFHGPTAAAETGQQALLMKAAPVSTRTAEIVHGLGVGVILERDRLGASGEAIYQADFYFPPEPENVPAVAVLATEPLLPPPANYPVMPRDYYRFGVTRKGFYFSCVSKKDPNADTYLFDAQMLASLPRPGWHRLAIVFEGNETIRCYVDGREPSFSPIQHSTLRKLQVGVMLAENLNHYNAYVDNLSIQLSGEEIDLPESPYAASWGADPNPSRTAPVPLSTARTGVEWLEPVAAWTAAQRLGRPLLLYFYSPSAPATLELNRILETDPTSRAFLARHSCTQVDIDQLQGGTIAQQYKVEQVPSVLIITPQATEAGRAPFVPGERWDTFAARLTAGR